MKKIITVLVAAFALFILNTNDAVAKGNKKVTCEIEATVDCQGCASKIKKSIAFEKGVKEIEVSVEKQLVTITYIEGKNTPEDLAKAIEKLGYKAKVKEQEDK